MDFCSDDFCFVGKVNYCFWEKIFDCLELKHILLFEKVCSHSTTTVKQYLSEINCIHVVELENLEYLKNIGSINKLVIMPPLLPVPGDIFSKIPLAVKALDIVADISELDFIPPTCFPALVHFSILAFTADLLALLFEQSNLRFPALKTLVLSISDNHYPPSLPDISFKNLQCFYCEWEISQRNLEDLVRHNGNIKELRISVGFSINDILKPLAQLSRLVLYKLLYSQDKDSMNFPTSLRSLTILDGAFSGSRVVEVVKRLPKLNKLNVSNNSNINEDFLNKLQEVMQSRNEVLNLAATAFDFGDFHERCDPHFYGNLIIDFVTNPELCHYTVYESSNGHDYSFDYSTDYSTDYSSDI